MIKCDRCGKEIKLSYEDMDIVIRYPSLTANVIDLCEDCQRELIKWIEEGVTNNAET